MDRKFGKFSIVAASAAVLATIATTAAFSHHATEGNARANSHANNTSVSVPLAQVQRAVVPDMPCNAEAAPTVPADLDAKDLALIKANPPSQTSPQTAALTRSDAIERAERMSTASQQQSAAESPAPNAASFPAAAAEVTYAQASNWLSGSIGAGQFSPVARTRCVWAVTVHAPISPRSVPAGTTPPIFDSYTVLFDVRSGSYLGLGAGTSAADLITGDRIEGVD